MVSGAMTRMTILSMLVSSCYDWLTTCSSHKPLCACVSSLMCECVGTCRIQFDQNASMYINASQLREFVRILPRPMGIGASVDQQVPDQKIKAFVSASCSACAA